MTDMFRAVVAVVAGWAFLSPAFANEPSVPPGSPTTDSVMTAFIGPGLDYRLTEIKDRLARDGEGDLIAWDFSDDDNKPFTEGGIGTEAAKEFAPFNAASIVVAKENSSHPQAFGQAMSFVAQTPARVILWLTGRPDRPDWPVFLAAAKHFESYLFIVPGEQQSASSAITAARGLDNVLVVDRTESRPMRDGYTASPETMGAVLGRIAGSAADAWSRLPMRSAKDMKAAMVTAHTASPETTPRK